MADQNSKPDLATLIADALAHIPVDKAKSIIEHPEAPGVVQKIRDALGIGQPTDVMSPQERLRYKEAVDIPATDTAQTTAAEEENRIRNQAISDMAVAASKPKETKSNYVAQEMLDGLVDMAAHGMKSKLKELSEAVKDAQSLSNKGN